VEAAEHRKRHVKNLSKHRSDVAKKYQDALEHPFTVSRGDVVHRFTDSNWRPHHAPPLEPKIQDAPKVENLVVLASRDKDVFQLAITANGHILKTMTN
jgi:hypothetical protein